MKVKGLRPEKLKKLKDTDSWSFKNTDGIILNNNDNEWLIGQDRAVEAMNFGLAVPGKGYNIFIAGNPGSGRTSYALDKLKDLAAKLPAPDDWLYLYNFDEAAQPVAISIPAGKGKKLAEDLENLVSDLKNAIGKAFEQSDFDAEKAEFVRDFQEKADAIMNKLKAKAEKNHFSLKRTPQGFMNIPLIDGIDEDGNKISREIEPDEFENLDAETQKYYHDFSEKVSQDTIAGLRTIRDMEKELKDKLGALEADTCRAAIEPFFIEINEEYKYSKELKNWFERMAADVVKNFGMFITAARDDSAEIDFSRYSVNLFVSNDPDKGAPVIWETNPTYPNIAGKIEYESHQSYLYTDFRRITAGALHMANGGFLIVDAEKVLMNYMSWEAIKRVVSTEESVIENLDEQYGFFHVSSLRPEAVKMNLKVIMTGSYRIYELLNFYDPEFQKLFKIKASFDFDMPRNSETEEQMARCVAGILKRENLMPFDSGALSEIIEWAGREAEDQELLSVELGRLRELLIEAGTWAKIANKKIVKREHVKKAVAQKIYRSALYQEKLTRAFKEGVLRIDTQGQAVGQINGLSVIEMSDYRFGHPSRITANVFMGQEGVVNIEREVKMTGPIHNKGLMILSSYLGRKYAQDMPLSLSARITFEQNYGGIEGDSASSTELYCIISALSSLPLSQEIAVTGSVDQFGNIQPVGGVNEKIEGFFECCKIGGLTGNQGVIIPAANAKHLMLSDEVIKAVKNKKFSIWAVNNIDEGIELLTGVKAGAELKNHSYPKNSVHGLAKARLKKMLDDSLKLENKNKKNKK